MTYKKFNIQAFWEDYATILEWFSLNDHQMMNRLLKINPIFSWAVHKKPIRIKFISATLINISKISFALSGT